MFFISNTLINFSKNKRKITQNENKYDFDSLFVDIEHNKFIVRKQFRLNRKLTLTLTKQNQKKTNFKFEIKLFETRH